MQEKTTTVLLRFEGKHIHMEIPQNQHFTGEYTVSLYWKDGKIMKAEVSKKASVNVEHLSTIDNTKG